MTAKFLLVAMVLSLALILGCSLGVPDAALAGEDLEEISEADFTGRVLIPIVDVRGGDSTIITTQIVPDARVVVLEGSLSGSSFTTDSEGRYRIPKLVGDSVRVRVEADGFQTKEATVHRSDPTFPPGDDRYRDRPGSVGDVQNAPGNILIGLPWPSEFKFVQEGNRGFMHLFGRLVIEVDSDLLLVHGLWSEDASGCNYAWGGGLIIIRDLNNIGCVVHEIAHSHQAARTWFHLGTTNVQRWTETPEGKAYQLAREGDRAEHGRCWFENDPHLKDTIYEDGAEAFVKWIGVHGDAEEFRRHCPHRAAWADEWITKLIE